jgi:hypothetical protein
MYLDPSFGGMLIQVLVAIVAGSGAIIFGMRRKIKAFFRKSKNNIPTNVSSQSRANGEDDIIDMLADENNEKG